MKKPASPSDKILQALHAFLAHFGIDSDQPPDRLIYNVASGFSRLPYENLSKIIRKNQTGDLSKARRNPQDVIADHIATGTGGTCFSLTNTLLEMLRALGWDAEPLLADRRYGLDTHCALLVWLDGEPHLLDPGYLILKPVRLHSNKETVINTAFNKVVLQPHAGGEKVDLSTEQKGGRVYRLTFKTSPVDVGGFNKAWDDSFDWDMMRYPLLTQVIGSKQVYLQGRKLQRRSLEALERREIPPEELTRRIAQEFGIDAGIVDKALAILKRKGENDGKAPVP